METLQGYLASCCKCGVVDHKLRATTDSAGNVSFYVHPDSVDGETLDFVVSGNMLLPAQVRGADGNLVAMSAAQIIEEAGRHSAQQTNGADGPAAHA